MRSESRGEKMGRILSLLFVAFCCAMMTFGACTKKANSAERAERYCNCLKCDCVQCDCNDSFQMKTVAYRPRLFRRGQSCASCGNGSCTNGSNYFPQDCTNNSCVNGSCANGSCANGSCVLPTPGFPANKSKCNFCPTCGMKCKNGVCKMCGPCDCCTQPQKQSCTSGSCNANYDYSYRSRTVYRARGGPIRKIIKRIFHR